MPNNDPAPESNRPKPGKDQNSEKGIPLNPGLHSTGFYTELPLETNDSWEYVENLNELNAKGKEESLQTPTPNLEPELSRLKRNNFWVKS